MSRRVVLCAAAALAIAAGCSPRVVERIEYRHDTTYVSKTDSIPYPVEVPVEVPAQLTWWQQTRLHLANIMLAALAIAGVVWGVRKRLKV